MKYSVPKTFSLYIFGSNSMIISKMWTEGFPDPADFAAYMGGLQAGAFEYDEPHEAQYDAEAEIPENPEESNQRVKKVKISIRNEDGMQSHMFNETDTVEQLQQWLALVVGRGHHYSIAHNNEMLTEDNSMTLKDAGLSPSALLRIQDNTGPMGQAPRRGDGAVNRAEAGNCWTRFVRRILLVLSFINPFASEGDQESFWEYQPSNNPDIAQVIATWTGIPVAKITETENEKLRHLEENLHKRVVGQDEAVSAVAKAIRRGRVGLTDPNRPTGSFLFLGPTGVGKTELAKALAEAMFGNENSMIRVDMSEFMESHSVAKLIGAPPGYVGYDEGGQLTEKVRRKPYSVILFDEVEKAHPDVMNMLLQILEDGRLTDSQGRTVNFKNTINIMTSNIGARLITDKNKLGFSGENNIDESKKQDYENTKKEVMAELKKQFRPELLNRIDDIIVFHKLEDEDVKKIIDIMLSQVTKRLEAQNIKIEITEPVKDLIAKKGVDNNYGARPLRRAIQNMLEDKIAEAILDGKVKTNKKAKAEVENDEIVIK